MQSSIKVFLLLISFSLFIACSDDAENKKDHVWKKTTETIDRAKAVESMILDSAANTQRTIEHQSE
jgi:hypothetical protein